MTTIDPETTREAVRAHYAVAAKTGGCCDSDPVTSDLYGPDEADAVPEAALTASLGCGNPTALADLRPGQVVLDLGSGGGIDVLLSARRVGPSGKAYGLDMTPEMLELARRNQREAGVANAEFLDGTLESIPLPDASVDVIISNCVVNLASDKDVVLREAFRVLRPGGRFAVSDIVLRRPLPEQMRPVVALWTGCVTGALVDADYRTKLEAAGFVDVGVETTRVLGRADFEGFVSGLADVPDLGGVDVDAMLDQVGGAVTSAFVRARKP